MRGNRSRRGDGRGGIVRNVPRPSPTILQVTDASIPAALAANSLVAPAISSFAAADPEAGEAALWDIWNQVVGYASKTPVHQLDRVVEVIAAVADLKEPAEFKIWGEKVTWKQLPLLGPVIRESWDNGIQPYFASFFLASTHATKIRWLTLSRATCRIVQYECIRRSPYSC